MRKIKTRKRIRLFSAFYILSLIISLLFLPHGALGQEVEAYEDYDTPLYVTSLEGATITWKIYNQSGVFVNETRQPGDLIQYKVILVGKNYTIDPSRKQWGKNDFKEEDFDHPNYYLTKRHWGEAAVKYMVNKDAKFWGNKSRLHTYYNLQYKTEWIKGVLMNTVTISFQLNKTNYDIIKYTRAEGIMLSRKAVVNANNGTTRGFLDVKLDSYDQIFVPSPWFYVIVVVLIISLIAIVIIIISLIIRRRRRMWREIDEI